MAIVSYTTIIISGGNILVISLNFSFFFTKTSRKSIAYNIFFPNHQFAIYEFALIKTICIVFHAGKSSPGRFLLIIHRKQVILIVNKKTACEECAAGEHSGDESYE